MYSTGLELVGSSSIVLKRMQGKKEEEDLVYILEIKRNNNVRCMFISCVNEK